jgi:hypothetical protein
MGDKVSSSPGWLRTCYTVEDDSDLLVLQLLLPRMGMTGVRNSRRAGTSRFATDQAHLASREAAPSTPPRSHACRSPPHLSVRPLPAGGRGPSRYGTPLSRSPVPHSSLDLQQRSRKNSPALSYSMERAPHRSETRSSTPHTLRTRSPPTPSQPEDP